MPLLRAVLAMVALVSQLVLGSLVLPDEATGAVAQLRSVAVLCTSAAMPQAPAHHRHHPAAPATCPLEIALALPAVILPAAIVLPLLGTSSAPRPFALPPARGPPAASAWALHARAPPHLT